MTQQLPPGRMVPDPRERGDGPTYQFQPPKPLREYVALLRRNAWLISLTGLVGLLLAGWLVSRQRPEFRAEATIAIADERRSMAGALGDDPVADQVLGRSTDWVQSELQVLGSRVVVAVVVDSEGLRLRTAEGPLRRSDIENVVIAPNAFPDTLRLRFADEGFVATNGQGESVKAVYGEPLILGGVHFVIPERPVGERATLFVDTRRAAIERVPDRASTFRREQTNVVDVRYVAHDPVMAQRVVNALVEEFQRYNQQEAQRQSRRRREFVQEQLRETEGLLEDARMALSAFRRREGVYSSREMFSAQQSAMLQLDVRREELAADRQMLSSLLGRLELGSASGNELDAVLASPILASSPVVTELFRQLVEQQARLDSLRATGAAATNPHLLRHQGLVADTRDKLAAAAESHLATLDARIEALNNLKARQEAEIRELPDLEAEEARLAQQVQTLATAAEQLRVELQRARIAEAVEAGQVQILDRAAVPMEPVASGRIRNVVFGLMLGLMFGGGVAVLRENLNTSIREKSTLEDSLRVAGLAVVPRLSQADGRLRMLPRSGNGKGGSRDLVIGSGERSAAAEAFRTLRTNLSFTTVGRSLRSVAITSPSPEEGKTTTAVNVAAAFAQQRSVVLVDADLRKGRLHRVFGLSRTPGLVELLMGEDALESAVQATDLPGLDVITTGPLPPNPAELLQAGLEPLLERLRERYDLVVLDTPPVLAAADVSVMGTLVDGVILVVKAGDTDEGAAKAAMDQLQRVEARVLGAVLNDPNEKVPRYGGAYYNYAYYGE